MSNESQETRQVKFVSRLASAGNSRKIIGVPASEVDKVKGLYGKPVLVTIEAIL